MLGIIRNVLGICMTDTVVRWPLQADDISSLFLFLGLFCTCFIFSSPLLRSDICAYLGLNEGEHSLALLVMAKWDMRHDGMRHVPTYREIINTGEWNAYILPYKKSDLPRN
jgi:hypothetical protein